MSKMWKHYCLQEKEDIDIGEGEECNWCGLDAEAVSIDGFEDALGMSWEEADEYAQFNITNVWVGDRTPMILYNEYWEDWKDDESSS